MRLCCRAWIAALGVPALLFGSVWLFPDATLNLFARSFYAHNAQKGADALVLLAGSPQNRIPAVVRYYREGYAPQVLLSDPPTKPSPYPSIFKSQNQIAEQILTLENIPHATVVNETRKVTSTFDEAYDIAEYCRTRGLTRVIIVTSAFHSARAHYAFEKVFGILGVETVVEVGTDRSMEEMRGWFATEAGWTTLFLESLKTVYYRFATKNSDIVKPD